MKKINWEEWILKLFALFGICIFAYIAVPKKQEPVPVFQQELSETDSADSGIPLRSADALLPETENSVPQRTSPETDRDINHADAEALKTVPGIGDALAERIIAYREQIGGFSAPEELLEVPGIGEVLAERILEVFNFPEAASSETMSEAEPAPPEKTAAPKSAPEKQEAAEPEEQESSEKTEIVPIDLNEANLQDLLQIPDMTEELAEAILRYREQIGGSFSSVYELVDVSGVSRSYFSETLKEWTFVSDEYLPQSEDIPAN